MSPNCYLNTNRAAGIVTRQLHTQTPPLWRGRPADTASQPRRKEVLVPKISPDKACSLDTSSSASGLYLGVGLTSSPCFRDLLKLLPMAPYC